MRLATRVILASLTLVLFSSLALAQSIDGEVPDEAEKALPLEDFDAWIFDIDETDQTARHNTSGLICPFNVQNLQLSSLEQYSLSGHDVSCGYSIETSSLILTFYMSWYGPILTPEESFNQAVEDISTGLTSVQQTSKSEVIFQIGSETLPCQEAILEALHQSQPVNTALWLCVKDGWYFKTRATWFQEDPFDLEEIAKFIRLQTDFLDKANYCEPVRRREQTEAILTSVDDAASLISMLAILDAKQTNFTPSTTACIIDAVSSETNGVLIQEWPDRPETPYTATISSIDGTADFNQFHLQLVEPITLVEELLEDNLANEDKNKTLDTTNQYALFEGHTDGSMTLWRAYESLPSREQFWEDLVLALNRDIPKIAALKINKNGGSDISIFTDAAEDNSNQNNPK